MSLKNTNQSNSVSVVIPAYNAEKHINRALDSVLAQTHPADEIIVVDDGSTDNTAQVVKKYGSPVHYIFQENAGAAAARNTAIKAATGAWIAFLDADDEWLPAKLELQLNLLQRNPDLVWVTCNYLINFCDNDTKHEYINPADGDRLLAGKEYLDNYLTAIDAGIGWNPVSMLIKRAAIEEVGFFSEDLHYVEDIDLCLRVAYRWPQIGFLIQPLAVWHSGVHGSFTREMPFTEKLIWDFELFERHLKLAAHFDKFEEVEPFIVPRIRQYIFYMYRAQRHKEVRNLLKRFQDILPLRYKMAMQLLNTFVPAHTPYCDQISRKMLALPTQPESKY